MNALELVRGREARSTLPAPLTVAAGRQHTAETILRAWFEGKADHTIRSYRHDLENFTVFLSRGLGVSPPLTVNEALGRLFKESSPSAHEIVLAFRNWMQSAHLSAASTNRQLACLRSVSKLARQLGLCVWFLEVQGVKAERRRDVRGPAIEDVKRLLAATSGDSEAETRDYAIVATFFALGLRVSELCGMNVEECDLARGTAWIKGKGRRERELVPLPAIVVDAIRKYLRASGRAAGIGGQRRYDGTRSAACGPLFRTRGQRGKARDGRLETRSVCRIVRVLGQRIGVKLWPHALRHSSITTAIEHGQKAGVGLDQIRHFSRHRNLATMLIYRDDVDKAATQRTLADLVAGSLGDDREDVCPAIVQAAEGPSAASGGSPSSERTAREAGEARGAAAAEPPRA
jgi:integrase/recombinase XerC